MVQNAGAMLKNRQTPRHEGVEIVVFTYFLTQIFARMKRKPEQLCKIKYNNLRF